MAPELDLLQLTQLRASEIRQDGRGLVLQAMGELRGARENFERALSICIAKLGEDHPSTKTVRGNLERLKSGR
jgi:hypothetical protein